MSDAGETESDSRQLTLTQAIITATFAMPDNDATVMATRGEAAQVVFNLLDGDAE